MADTTQSMDLINGIDIAALAGVAEAVAADPAEGKLGFRVTTGWCGATASETRIEGYELAGKHVPRNFTLRVDEPTELLGGDSAPNPQEYLMTALNACIMVGYVAGASMRGIRLDSVEIETTGELDLRGFLGLDPQVPAGYEVLRYTVRIKGEGTPEQFREIHENVLATSPNYFNVTRPVPVEATLEIAG
ncbi:MAG: osmotically inducible protein C [Rhizobiales bacterium NRL2]|nr:MAG: osmotically inducible protein C [Rhizobiales bacterium NRL2]